MNWDRVLQLRARMKFLFLDLSWNRKWGLKTLKHWCWVAAGCFECIKMSPSLLLLNAKFVNSPASFQQPPQGNNNKCLSDSETRFKTKLEISTRCLWRKKDRSLNQKKLENKPKKKREPKVNALLISQNLPHLVDYRASRLRMVYRARSNYSSSSCSHRN